jgi:hypothetical protein
MFMRSGKKSKHRVKQTPGVTAAEVGRLAGCSAVLARRLLLRGFSPAEIVARIAENKAREAAKTGLPMDLPAIPLNGHGEVTPFAVSQAKKEESLAQLRALQVAKAKGELVALQPWYAINVELLRFAARALECWETDLPPVLVGTSEAQMTEVIHKRTCHLFAATEQFRRVESEKYGIVLPPPEPPPPSRPPDTLYSRYVKDSKSGKIERIPIEDFIGSQTWRKRHPSISFQAEFKLIAAKRQWDLEMSQLLDRRGTWDLPPEPGTDEDEPESLPENGECPTSPRS